MHYVVWRDGRGYLALEGPFCYPRWLYSIDGATRLTWVQAHDYAHAYGGEVRAG